MTNPYLDHLPIGQPIPLPENGIPDWDIFPYEGDIKIKSLEPPGEEKARRGEAGAESCRCQERTSRNLVWTDGRWKLVHTGSPTSVPAVVLLEPVAHHDLSDLPTEMLAELGPMLRRVELAIMDLGGIGRVHINKWGDGSAHLHVWLFGRPAGMAQLLGSCLPMWDDVLPKMPRELWESTLAKIGSAMAAGGGEARLTFS